MIKFGAKFMSFSLVVAFVASPSFAANTSVSPYWKQTKATCTISVSSKTYLASKCIYRVYSDGSISIDGRKKLDYFVQLDAPEGKFRRAFWNGPDIRATHAHSYLGDVKKQGNCWVNEQAQICVSDAA